MRIGYGYNRIEKEFAHANCDRIWIDSQHTDREERRAMLSTGLRSGDTLVLLARGDLGHGGELTIIHQSLAQRNIALEVAKKIEPKRPQGRPAKFEPTSEHDAEFLRKWKDPLMYTVAFIIADAKEKGYNINRNNLTYRYGARTKEKADR